jgi:biuret amidohydrolase
VITLAADPGPYAFDPARTALVCIDFQRDFVEPGGFGETLGNDVSTLRWVLTRGSRGHDIIPELYPAAGEVVLDKPGKGAFCATDLETILRARGITHLILTGVTTEVCVQTTAREANDRGFDCLVLADCTGSYFPQFHRAALQMISAQGGIVGWVADSAALLDAIRIGGRE